MSYVLLADDDQDYTEALMHFLNRAGHRAAFARNGEEALESVIGKLPDVLVLDVQMPVMGGLHFLQLLRSYVRLSQLPVILFTADDEATNDCAWEKLGVRAVLVKARHGPLDVLRAIESVAKDQTMQFSEVGNVATVSHRPFIA